MMFDHDRETANRIKQLEEDNKRLKKWIDDLQSGMYVNCVYCGHQYGPAETTPATMADALKEHIEQCPEHPMSKLKAKYDELLKTWVGYRSEGMWENKQKEYHAFNKFLKVIEGHIPDDGEFEAESEANI